MKRKKIESEAGTENNTATETKVQKVKAPRTNFEAAQSARKRLEIAQGGNSVELRPVHPSEKEDKLNEFCETYDFDRKDLTIDYSEGGLSLKIRW